jgi:carboxyl-terminal processing protease
MDFRRVLLFGLAAFVGLAPGGCAHQSVSKSPKAAASEQSKALETFDAAWQIINTTHFDTNFNGVDWAKAKVDFRPKAAAAKDVYELREVIQEMLDLLNESHMRIIPGRTATQLQRPATAPRKAQAPSAPTNAPSVSGEPGDPGLEVRLRDGQAIVFRVDPDGPATKAGIKPGWTLREIDHQPISKLMVDLPRKEERARFLGWQLLSAELKGPAGTQCTLRFLNSQRQPISFDLERRKLPGEAATYATFPTFYTTVESRALTTPGSRKAGYIRFNLFMLPVAPEFDKAVEKFRSSNGIIIDLRGNVGGLGALIMGMSGHFTTNRVSLGTLKNREAELHFFTNPRLVNPAGERVEPFQGPLAILIDEISLSASEIFAGGLQAIGRARVFGERSGGQALPAIFQQLPNGDVLYHVFSDFVTPKGARLEKTGVIPDEEVPLSRAALLAGKDEPLEAALKWFDSLKTKHTQ